MAEGVEGKMEIRFAQLIDNLGHSRDHLRVMKLCHVAGVGVKNWLGAADHILLLINMVDDNDKPLLHLAADGLNSDTFRAIADRLDVLSGRK
jgi:hypothetical protein